jgi:hypothetical protein
MAEATGKQRAVLTLPDLGLDEKQLKVVRERMENAVVGVLKDVGVDPAKRSIVWTFSVSGEA